MHLLKTKNKFFQNSDNELINYYKSSNNQEYLVELYKRYSHLILFVCVKYLGNREEAKDATMDIYEKLVKTVSSSEIDNFKNWIYTVSKNHCLMIKRKKNIKTVIMDFSNIHFMGNDTFLHQEDENIFTEELIKEKIKELKDVQRDCIERFYYKKQSYKEIAKIISITEKKVKSYLQNGKRNLRILILDAIKGIDN